MFSILLCVAIHYNLYYVFPGKQNLLLIDGNAYKIIDEMLNKFDVKIKQNYWENLFPGRSLRSFLNSKKPAVLISSTNINSK
jgi:hypothetical protein